MCIKHSVAVECMAPVIKTAIHLCMDASFQKMAELLGFESVMSLAVQAVQAVLTG